LPYLGGWQLGTQLIRFLDRGTQLVRPRLHCSQTPKPVFMLSLIGVISIL
jgi:hypothetical protein